MRRTGDRAGSGREASKARRRDPLAACTPAIWDALYGTEDPVTGAPRLAAVSEGAIARAADAGPPVRRRGARSVARSVGRGLAISGALAVLATAGALEGTAQAALPTGPGDQVGAAVSAVTAPAQTVVAEATAAQPPTAPPPPQQDAGSGPGPGRAAGHADGGEGNRAGRTGRQAGGRRGRDDRRARGQGDRAGRAGRQAGDRGRRHDRRAGRAGRQAGDRGGRHDRRARRAGRQAGDRGRSPRPPSRSRGPPSR